MKKYLITILLWALVFSFCSAPKSDKPQILVSPKGLALSFWTKVKDGAEEAGREFDVEIIWKGPASETDISRQISIVEDNINKQVDAIVIAACGATSLIPVLKKADAAGIPVITIDSNIDSDLPKSFVATDNILAAEKAVDVLAELLGGKGKIAFIPFIAGAATNTTREQGFERGLAKYPGLELVAKQYSQSDVARAMALTEDIVTAHQDLDGIFVANEAGTIGCAQALKSRGLSDKLEVVGFDASPNEIEALQDGTLDALIVQNPHLMGYYGVKAAVDILNGKQVEKRIDTGVSVVTRDNLNTPEIQKLLNPAKTE